METLNMAEGRFAKREQIGAVPEVLNCVDKAPPSRFADGHVTAADRVTDVLEHLESLLQPVALCRPVGKMRVAPAPNRLVQAGVVCEFELINRHAFRREINDTLDSSLPGVAGLAGQTGKQVNIDLVEAGSARLFESIMTLVECDAASVSSKDVIVQRLETEADASNAALFQGTEFLQ
jgi:hypothetical protein